MYVYKNDGISSPCEQCSERPFNAHANHRLPWYCEAMLFPTSDVLSERKYRYWHHCDDESCSLQDQDCYVYDRPNFIVSACQTLVRPV